MAKQEQLKIRLTKSGKPFKNDLKRAKSFVKNNFTELNPEQLPKQVQGYYNLIDKAKKRIVVRNPETGKILGGKIREKVLTELKTASEFSGIPISELLSKENYETVFKSAISEKISFSGTLQEIEKYLQMGYTYGAQIDDGNGLVQVSVEKIYNRITRIQQYLTEYGFFAAFWSGTIEASGKVTIKIPDFLNDLINGSDFSDEDLIMLINEASSSKEFNAIKSGDKNGKKRKV